MPSSVNDFLIDHWVTVVLFTSLLDACSLSAHHSNTV
jgi:hypothetical protein